MAVLIVIFEPVVVVMLVVTEVVGVIWVEFSSKVSSVIQNKLLILL